MGLAEAHHASGSEHRAALERQAARTILEGIQATLSVAPPVHVEDHDAVDEQPAAGVNVFRREGDYWSVIFEGHTVRVRDLKGMRYLARLLADPGREYHVLDLVAAETGSGAQVDSSQAAGLPRSALGDAGESLDAQAKDAYRRRLAEIGDDLEQARAIGDAERAAQADAERDFLVQELARVPLGWPRSTSRIRIRARPSRSDPRGPPGDDPDRRAPSPARPASQPHHPHGNLLRLRSRPSRPCPLEVLTSTDASRPARATPLHRGHRPSRACPLKLRSLAVWLLRRWATRPASRLHDTYRVPQVPGPS
jgi:hypothetical protein